MEVINLNLIPSGALPVVHASQYDEGRTFRANLMDGSTVYTLDGTEVLECDVKKPDGNIVTVAVTNTSDSYVEIDTTLQMCACAGESLAELHITKGAQEIGTLNFILAVERSPLEGGIQSDSGIHNLQTQIGEAVADQYAAEDVVFDAAPVAGHGTGFAVTSEGVKTYVEGEIAALTIPEELDDLSDVTTSAPSSGEALVWDGSKWVNGTPDMDVSDLADVTITTPSDDDILVYQNGEWVNMANPASTANFADAYDPTATYNTGDVCIYNNVLYICTAPTTGDFDPSKWTATTIDNLIGSLSTLTTTDKSSLVGAVNEVVSTKATTRSAITFAPETGVTASATSAVINKTVLLNLTFTGSFTQNNWTKIGAMNVTPYLSTVYVAGVHSADGLYAGMIQIRSDKGIYFYPKIAISGTVGCTANFNIT